VGKSHGPQWQATRKPRSPQEDSEVFCLPARSYFPGQFPSEHMGLGAPPSANDDVDMAPRNSSVASSKGIIFFMKIPLLRSIKNAKPPYVSATRGWKLFENRTMVLLQAVGLPTKSTSAREPADHYRRQVYPHVFRKTFAEGLKKHQAITSSRDGERRSTDGLSDSPFCQALETILLAASLRPEQNGFFQRQTALAACGGDRKSAGVGAARIRALRRSFLRSDSGTWSASAAASCASRESAGRFGPSSRSGRRGFVEVVAHAGPAGGPSGLLWRLGHFVGRAQRRSVIAGGSAAHIALRGEVRTLPRCAQREQWWHPESQLPLRPSEEKSG
jgi:hypothetical protein